jgi:hypothetical protein
MREGLPVRHGLGHGTVASLTAAAAVLLASGAGLAAGLLSTAIGAFGNGATEAAWRGHWAADWILGTPALITGGVLLWARRPVGYTVAPGLLLVSALGGVVFAVAAVVDNLSGGLRTEGSVVVVHLVISAGALAVLVWFLTAPHRAALRARKPHARPGTPASGTA